MELFECILKICPNWKGSVTGNIYEGIKPHKLETRPIPSLAELEAVWPQVEADRIAAEEVAKIEVEKESLIQAKIREMAISELYKEGKLTVTGELTTK